MRKDEKTIQDIKSVLSNFQQNYNEKDFDNIESVINEFFINEKDTSFVGAGLNSWCFGLGEITTNIKSYWEDENKYLENIELDIDKSVINIENSVAVIALHGKSIRNIKQEKTCEAMVDQLSRELNNKEVSKSTLIKLSNKLVTTLNDIKRGEEYIWPFRVTIVMINDGLKWMIKHMTLSFSSDGNELMLTNENIDDKFKVIPIDKKDSVEIAEVQEILKTLQEAYDKRDTNLVDNYGEELLDNSELISIIGTDQGEVFHGFNEAKELLKSDWKYWGDFNLNRENAYISVLDNIAVVYSKALIKFTWKEQNVCSWPKQNFEWYLKLKKTNTELINLMLLSINNSLDILETSDKKTTVSMKFVGILVKRDGRWKFNHMHFSDSIDGTPARIEVL
ncbi:hypothetical protein [Clostridium sp. CF012]|uniref:hypothetical protein n=1 Tax=Clostridium sp. CF012 TaxID=2843319 RepID=UPI001C0B4116|nr:hypothetical protein [Clostridium sp. CF012]MBU3144184.1 hypothetical protein [Clostridium sp. CF012]